MQNFAVQFLFYSEPTVQKLGLKVIKLFSCSTQLNIKFIMLINVKKQTILCVQAFISMINTLSENLKA